MKTIAKLTPFGSVFGNLRGNKRLHRLTLRGKTKVDGRWKLYCMMHNIEKLAKPKSASAERGFGEIPGNKSSEIVVYCRSGKRA